jgi:hypothetical protein
MLFIISKTGQETRVLEANCKRCGANVPMEAFYLDAKRDAAPRFYHSECVAAIPAALNPDSRQRPGAPLYPQRGAVPS